MDGRFRPIILSFYIGILSKDSSQITFLKGFYGNMLHNGTYQASTAPQAEDHKPRSRFMRIFWRVIHIATGIILVWLPWTSAWENNLTLWLWPQIEQIVRNPFFKGAVIGLGIDNIIIGIHDVIHARFSAKRHFN